MSKIEWDKTGERFYETGVDRGVHYSQLADGSFGNGVAWNGLSSVSENPDGGEPSPVYADNIPYLNLVSAEKMNLTIEAYTYPDAFAECDGSAEIADGVTIGQQTRKPFGLCYRSLLGNDTKSNDYGYKLHLAYNCLAQPTEKGYETVDDDVEAITSSWEVSTTPVNVTGFKPTATLTVDSTKCTAEKLAALEEILYGKENVEPRLPFPDEVMTLMKNNASSGSSGS